MDNVQVIIELLYASILHEGDEQNNNDCCMPRLVGMERVGTDLKVTLTSGLRFRITEIEQSTGANQ